MSVNLSQLPASETGFTSRLITRLINGILAVDPLANWIKHQARQMMVKRAEKLGIPWQQQVETLLGRNWDLEFTQVTRPDLIYPQYYLQPFHAYGAGNLTWQAAAEVEVAAQAVHAKIWPEAGIAGDARLRQSYHEALQAKLAGELDQFVNVLDLGCGIGLSTFTLQKLCPQARITGVDLSPYFLAIALYRSQNRDLPAPTWLHAPAESTGLPDQTFDLVSLCLVCHELPQTATQGIFQEAKRLLRSGGYLAIMDMNPESGVLTRMPPYILTLLKSTEPYLDQYLTLNFEQALAEAGFELMGITANSPRHRTILAQSR
ncbi:MAG: class I SAM-dependent methyltransferase [Oscillatoriales cyanobacterium RM2_1_1]|nr:class I SAM-dependent methyltransferase [Oscillatoriales cyanobacterium SM2_3_0]NJO46019.1 class I SAM-dependent methyltransferase [Oscillatoriales cyanobacterium RM2_1_1]